MEKAYVICDPEDLRQLCIRENWFTAGSNEQYAKMFFMNDHPHMFAVRDIAEVIWLCSKVDTDILYERWKQGKNIETVTDLSTIFHQLEKEVQTYQAAFSGQDEESGTESPEMPRMQKPATYPEVYMYTLRYADKHGELDICRESNRLNTSCREKIEQVIREHYDGAHFDDGLEDAIRNLLALYGRERVSFILADTLQYLAPHDGRISADNKEWAQLIIVPTHLQIVNHPGYYVRSHPYILDGFVSIARKLWQQS